MTGYNINQLMGDRRFKLNTALFEAGLANTDYAREVLNKMSMRPQPQNPWNLSPSNDIKIHSVLVFSDSLINYYLVFCST